MNYAILDYGHGKETPGKRSPIYDGKQIFEWEFNRQIGERIKSILNSRGVPFFETIDTDDDIPLSFRVDRANDIYRLCKSNGDLAYLVSLHANAGGGTGWEIFTSRGQTISDAIAQDFYKYAKLAFPEFRMRVDTSDGDADKESDFYILKKTMGPAVLIESFFMDNMTDFNFIYSEEGKTRIAECYSNVIEKIIDKRY